MAKRNTYIIVGIVFLLAFLAGNFIYPEFLRVPYLPKRDFKLGLDLQGGIHLLYEADLSQTEEREKSEAMAGLRDVIERRVNLFGVREPLVQVQGERLIVELAGVIDPAEAIKMIGETPYLEFLEFKPDDEIKKILDKREEIEGKNPEEYQKVENWQIAFENIFEPAQLTGRYLKKAQLVFDPTTNKPEIQLQFDEEGSKLFEEITARNVGRRLAIFLDGASIIDTDGDGEITANDLYAPVVQEKITGGRAVITGETNVQRSKEIVQRLNSGALPVPITLISQQSVGPTLGKISLEQSLRAGFLGFLAIIIFIIFFYRLPGILAGLALAIYILLALSVFKLIPVTLTLAGIGGFILSIGMAIDANILIFARMQEELKSGKNFSQSLEESFNRAWPAIRDGNLTTLIVAAILFGFGTSFIKGFATTLSIGILISMFTAIIITKNFLRCFIATKLEKVKLLWG